MKITYLFLITAGILWSCSNAENTADQNPNVSSVNVDYALLVENNDKLSVITLRADAETMLVSSDQDPLSMAGTSGLRYTDGNEISWFSKLSDGNGTMSKYDFATSDLVENEIFPENFDDRYSIEAIAHSGQYFFLAYTLQDEGRQNQYFVRLLDVEKEEEDDTDVELPLKPLQLIASQGRLFALTLDEANDQKYKLLVLDTETKQWIYEKNLGNDVQKLLKTEQGNILIAYPKLHTIIDHNTFTTISEVRYAVGSEPNLGSSRFSYFFGDNMYYYTHHEQSTEYPLIPAVYQFGTNTAVLYLYENFLSREQREFQFEIANTTMVAYDHANNIILIGYRKKGNANRGGLLRIKPVPAPRFVDNIDLEGVPSYLFLP